MTQTNVRRRCDLESRDQQGLEMRIDHFREALLARQGRILEIHWRDGGFRTSCRASIVYQIPIFAVTTESNSASA